MNIFLIIFYTYPVDKIILKYSFIFYKFKIFDKSCLLYIKFKLNNINE